VLPVVLGIILVAAFIAIESSTGLAGTTLLATQRQLHQHAFEAAESGAVAAMEQLASGVAAPLDVRVDGVIAASATVASALTSRVALSEGFSSGRVAEVHYEIRSTGHSARNSNVTVVQGVRQLQAVPP
jgi:hypothetical protein